jgi:PD-(D/E)XK nuclease superfamily
VELPALNPAQQDVVELLGAVPTDRPEFDPDLRHHLRGELELGVDDAVSDVDPDDPLWVSKHKLQEVHGCEAKFRADEVFTVNPANARGVVTHKAIELSVSMSGEPLDLIEEAIARLEHSDQRGDQWVAQWLQTCSEGERAEVTAEANDRLVKLLDCWPPLNPRWRPAPESRLYADLVDKRVVLAGKVDLALGRAEGSRAGKVLVDLKTGRSHAAHREDLRFYALIETLRLGVPPRRLATHYLDSGRIEYEDVTVDLLEAAVARTIDGIRAMVELRDPVRPLVKKPGPPCGWCALADECAEGQAWLSDQRGY